LKIWKWNNLKIIEKRVFCKLSGLTNQYMEIERKFLVKGEYKMYAVRSFRIVQGYLSSVTGRTVRIRIKGDKGYITIKGKSNESGLSRYEWEKEIPLDEAEELLLLCEPRAIDKTRFEVPAGKHIFEVDEFYGDNQGLTMAEVELESEDEPFTTPDWLGMEVTGDRRYYNSSLTKKPYKEWK
jgi:adenylate cyclase